MDATSYSPDDGLTKEQRRSLASLTLDHRYTVDLNEASRVEAILADGRVAIIDIDGDTEFRDDSLPVF